MQKICFYFTTFFHYVESAFIVRILRSRKVSLTGEWRYRRIRSRERLLHESDKKEGAEGYDGKCPSIVEHRLDS